MKQAVETWGHDGVLMVTMTVRHGLGHDLRVTRKGIANAWRKMQAGRWWKDYQADVGMFGMIRALEVTHGWEHGWHPHLHALVFALRPERVIARESELVARWQVCVERELGAAHVPDDEHGLTVRPCHQATYIAKLGLEVASPTTKRAEGGNRNPWEIADDIRTSNQAQDVQLWKTYCDGMRGARMLTWTLDLRAKLGMSPERTDAEVALEEPKSTTRGQIYKPTWRALGRVSEARVYVLELVEQAGWPRAAEYITAVTGHVPQDVEPLPPRAPPPPRAEYVRSDDLSEWIGTLESAPAPAPVAHAHDATTAADAPAAVAHAATIAADAPAAAKPVPAAKPAAKPVKAPKVKKVKAPKLTLEEAMQRDLDRVVGIMLRDTRNDSCTWGDENIMGSLQRRWPAAYEKLVAMGRLTEAEVITSTKNMGEIKLWISTVTGEPLPGVVVKTG